MIVSFLFSLLLLTPNVSLADNDTFIDFVGTYVIITRGDSVQPINVKHLMDRGASVDEIVNYVLRMMR